MNNNLTAIIELMKFINDNCHYAEINTKSDVCFECGGTENMVIGDDFLWTCESCGNNNQKRMQVLRRTCGLTGSR